MKPSHPALRLRVAFHLIMLFGVVFVFPLAFVQQGYAQTSEEPTILEKPDNPNPGTGTEDDDQDEEKEKSEEESEQDEAIDQNGTRTNMSGLQSSPSVNRQTGPGNTADPYASPSSEEDCPEPPGPSPDPEDDPYPDPDYYPFIIPTPPITPEPDGSFSTTFNLYGPGAVGRGSVRFFTHEFRNPGLVALRANIPPGFTVNATTLLHPENEDFTYKRINFIDTGAMRIEFAAAPAALLALDPNAFTATEKNAAGQQIRKTTISFVTESGIGYFRMDVEELGSVTRHEQTNPSLNKLVSQHGLYTGDGFAPLRRVTLTKNFDNASLRKERITIEERPSVSHAYQVVSDRELWREAVRKDISVTSLKLEGGAIRKPPVNGDNYGGTKVGITGEGTGGSRIGSKNGDNSPRPPIPSESSKAWVKNTEGDYKRRHTPHYYWRVVREIIDPTGPNPQTNIWQYYGSSDGAEAGFSQYAIGRIKSYLMHDGRQGRFTYSLNRDTVKTPYAGDPEGMVTVAEWNSGTRTRTITSTVGGKIRSKVVQVHTATSVTRSRQTEAGNSLVTVVKYVPDYQLFGGLPTLIQLPNNTLTTYAYARTSVGGIQTVMERGATSDGLTVSEGLRTTTVTNSRDHEIFREVKAIGHGSANGRIYGRMAVTGVDSHGRATTTAYHPQSISPESGADMGESIAASNPAWITTTVSYCCGPTSTTDRNGITTYYAYDGLKRRIKTHRLGVTTEILRNGLTTETFRYPETVNAALSPAFNGTATDLVSRSVRNLTRTLSESWSPDPTSATAGALVKSSSTVTTFQPAAGLSRRTVTTTADNFSQTTDFFLDGRTAKTSGALSPAMVFSYGVNDTGVTTSRSYLEGTILRETVTTHSDWAGRGVRMDYMDGSFATMHYNSKGQMVRSVDPDGVVTLHAYNVRGERTTTATDLFPNASYNDEIDNIAYGTDSVQFFESVPAFDTITLATGNEPVWKTISKVWQDGQTSPTGGTIVSTALRSANGLSSSSQSIGVANPSSSFTTLSGNGDWMQKSTNPDNTYTLTSFVDGRMDITKNFGSGDTLISSTSMRDASNAPLSGYDDWNRPTHQRDSRTGVSATEYLSATADVVKSVTDPGNRTTAFTYDVRGRQVSVNAPDSIDADGAPLLNVTITAYNADDTVAEVNGAQTYRTTHTYDYARRMITLTTYGTETATTEWKYSPDRGFLTEKNYHGETDDGQADADYSYTAAGRLLTRTWERGITTTYGYDKGGRMASTNYSDTTPDVLVTYDALSRPLNVKNGAGTFVNDVFTIATPLSSSDFIYDPATLAADTETVSHDIDLNGTPELTRVIDRSRDTLNRTSGWQLKNGATAESSVEYQYSATDSRISSISNPQLSNSSFGYSYEPNSYGLIKTFTGPIHTVTNTWETNRDVLALKENKVGVTNISSYDYGVNSIGQRTDVAKTGSAFAGVLDITWGYNSKGEVTRADHTIPGLDRSYLFDGIGNRVKSADSLTLPATDNYTPNALNQYTAVENIVPVHDADGNATAYPLPAYPTTNSTLTWDAENRLISADVNGSITNFRYDAQSRRIAVVSTGGTATLTIYDGWNPIAEYGSAGFQPASLIQSFTWGIDLSGSTQGAGGVGGLLMVTVGSNGSADRYFPTYDGNGNVSEYLDSVGAVQAHYEYDPFGRTTVATGPKANDFAHRFSTKPLDVSTGLYYYGYRFYSPVTGSWSSRDPIKERGGVNLYGFVGNDGVNLIDIFGRQRYMPGRPVLPQPNTNDLPDDFIPGQAAAKEQDNIDKDDYNCCDEDEIKIGEDLLNRRYSNYTAANPDVKHNLNDGDAGYQPKFSCFNINRGVLDGLEQFNININNNKEWVEMSKEDKALLKLQGIPKCWTCRLESGKSNVDPNTNRSWDHWVVICKARDKTGAMVKEIEFDYWKNPNKVTPGIDPNESFRKHYPLPDDLPWTNPVQRTNTCSN